MERTIYRIIDANFNRSREACRLIEEFCRFVLNSRIFTDRAKKIRHELSSTIGSPDSQILLASRDTKGDVGAARIIDEQIKRNNIEDSFTAACKRLGEALRVLAESLQSLDSEKSMVMERLRFAAYELEKDIVLFYKPKEKYKNVRLYVIITSDIPDEIIRLTKACAKNGADCIQLRAKNIDSNTLFRTACDFVKICKDNNVLSIINDRADIAVACDADGVHIGLNDIPIEQVRKLQLKPLIIGCTTHSVSELKNALEKTPTYVSLGPVFATGTKPTLKPVGLDYVKQGTELLIEAGTGHAAIGGITIENVSQVLKAGAQTIAICAAITKADDPAEACRKFKQAVADFDK
ncbi:MAG: thiamine phosphate synthase [Phycisphaerae bacterium]